MVTNYIINILSTSQMQVNTKKKSKKNKKWAPVMVELEKQHMINQWIWETNKKLCNHNFQK